MTIYLLTCGSTFLLAFILISNSDRVNSVANRWLSFFFFCIGCALLGFIAGQTELRIRYPYLIQLTELTRYAMAPSLYLGVLFFTSAGRKLMPKDYLHFIPAVLFLFLSAPFLLRSLGLTSYSGDIVVTNTVFSRYLGLVVSAGVKVQLLIYWLLAFRLLLQHQRNIRLWWLKYLLWGVACMMIIWYNQIFNVYAWGGHFTGAGYFIAVYLIGYFSLKQREMLPQPAVIPQPQPRLSESEMLGLQARLEALMTDEKVFTDNELGLTQLAQKIDVSIHQLSYLLNKGYGKNFFQYVNSYRVELAKELLLSEQHRHLSVLGIAFEAGFNSKTTFNTAFKKATGLSPSAWQQRAKDL